MSKTVWGSKTGLWVGHISSNKETEIVTVALSTIGHGGCIHGPPSPRADPALAGGSDP